MEKQEIDYDKLNKYNIKLINAEDYIELVEKLMNDGEVLHSIEVAKKLEEDILDEKTSFKNKKQYKQSKNKDDNNDHEELLSDYEIYENNKTIKSSKSDDDLIFHSLDNYKRINKRDPDRSSDGIDSWFNYEDNINSITMCGRTTLNCKMINLIAMFKETDLLQKSVDQFEFLNVCTKLSFCKWIAHTAIKMPLTIQNRDLVLVGVALFDRKEKLFIIAFKSPVEDEYEEFVPKKDDKHCRITMNFGFYIAKYLDEDHAELFTCFNVDPKISVPWFLINTFTKDVSYHLIKDFKTIIEKDNFSEIYSKRIEENKEDYDKIKIAIDIK